MPVAHITAMPVEMKKKTQSIPRNPNDPDVWFELAAIGISDS
jgi:hypothetical protein